MTAVYLEEILAHVRRKIINVNKLCSSQIEHSYCKFICGIPFVGDIEKKDKINLRKENFFLLFTFWNVASVSYSVMNREWQQRESKIQIKEQLSLKGF